MLFVRHGRKRQVRNTRRNICVSSMYRVVFVVTNSRRLHLVAVGCMALVVALFALSATVDPQVHDATRPATSPPSSAPLIAVLVSLKRAKDQSTETRRGTRRKTGRKRNPKEKTPLEKLLLSLVGTMDESFRYVVYVGCSGESMEALRDELRSHVEMECISTAGDVSLDEHTLLNQLAKAASEKGAEYLVHIQEDGEFVSPQWTRAAINALESLDPPNVGIVAPVFTNQESTVSTTTPAARAFMIHATHLQIFGGGVADFGEAVRSPVVSEWLFRTYGKARSATIPEWSIMKEEAMQGEEEFLAGEEFYQLVLGGREMITRFICGTLRPDHTIHQHNFHSQTDEDFGMVESMFGSPPKCGKDYTMLEIGAFDGSTFSNSFFFEFAMGWRTLHIEANPANFENLVRNRPQSINIHAAMCQEGKTKTIQGSDAVGALVDVMSDEYKNRWKENLGAVAQVECRLFESIFKEHSVKHIDLFVLDVQGAEYMTLQAMDWSVSVGAWLVELEEHSEEETERSGKVRELLKEKGYVEANWNIQDWCHIPDKCASNVVFVPKDSAMAKAGRR